MQSGRTNRPLVAVESKVRARRLKPENRMTAETRTIGAPLAFVMHLENVSETGFLLTSGVNGRVPYQVNTLIELTLDPKAHVIGRPIHLLGRIVRTNAAADNGGKQFGVHIVQMDSRDHASWEKFVEELAGTPA